MAIQVEFWGDYACFTRPEMKVERVSYDVPTPSAARGMLEAIYWHPGMRWHIDKIYVLSDIAYTNLRRNEVKATVLASVGKSAMLGSTKPAYLATSQEIQQRAAMLLKNVHYVIEAHFSMTEKAAPGDNPGKFQDIIKRRLDRGQCYHQPCFGCREFPANFQRWQGGAVPSIAQTRDLGYMLYDMDYATADGIQPTFFHAMMENGVVQVADCEVLR